ncbi:MAG: hypothetical protein IJK74_06595 [Bacteroidales bacterium]|nr:hypothetical protein [Bacteroidales bacterium]
MDTVEKKTRKKWNWELILGIFFLIPPILGVFAFIYYLFWPNTSCVVGIFEFFRIEFSTTPVYFGLMALAGAYLIKNNLGRK